MARKRMQFHTSFTWCNRDFLLYTDLCIWSHALAERRYNFNIYHSMHLQFCFVYMAHGTSKGGSKLLILWNLLQMNPIRKLKLMDNLNGSCGGLFFREKNFDSQQTYFFFWEQRKELRLAFFLNHKIVIIKKKVLQKWLGLFISKILHLSWSLQSDWLSPDSLMPRRRSSLSARL